MIRLLRYFGGACIIIGLLLMPISWIANNLLFDSIAKVILIVGNTVCFVWVLFLKGKKNGSVATEENEAGQGDGSPVTSEDE